MGGFKVYIFDVGGEYYPLYKLAGGMWVDYTMGTGLYSLICLISNFSMCSSGNLKAGGDGTAE